VLAGCAAYAAAWLAPRPAPTLDENLIVVAPFDAADPSLGLWREGMVDVLSAALNGAGPLRTVSPSRFVRGWRGPADPASADTLAGRMGARYAVLGQLGRIGGDSVRIVVALYDAAARRSTLDAELRGPAARLEMLADSVVVGLLRELGATRPIGAVRVRRSSLGARSLPALKAFLQGEQYYRRNQWDSAQAFYERAVLVDSTFALGLHRMRGVLRRFDESDPTSLRHALAAGRMNRGLAPRDSLIIAADSSLVAVRQATVRDATWWFHLRQLFARLDAAEAHAPDDPEVRAELGEATYHFGDHVGRDERRALRTLLRATELDPDFAPPYYHLVEMLLRLDGADAALPLLRAYERLNPADSAVRLVRALAAERPTAPRRARLTRTLSTRWIARAAYLVHRWPDPDETALHLYREVVARGGGGDAGALRTAWRQLFFGLSHRGHVRAAAALAGDTLVAHPALGGQLLAAGLVADTTVDRLVPLWMRGGDARSLVSVLPHLALRGDTAAVRRVGAWCAGAPSGAGAPASPRCYGAFGAAVAGAYLTLARGDTAGALRALASVTDSLCVRDCTAHRLTRARLLLARGRAGEAAALLDRFPMTPERYGAFEGGWLAARASAASQLGDQARARALSAELSALWRHADAEVWAWFGRAPAAGAPEAAGRTTR
jgi:serine/threonine-protein kinase